MLAKLLLLFTITPIVETYLLVLLGQHLGFWWTALIVLITGVVGATLGKREGLKVWHAWRDSLAVGQMPEEGIVGGVLVLIGGVLLVTPGVLTDITGLALLAPPSRKVIAAFVRKRLEAKFAGGTTTSRVRVDMGGQVYEHVRTRVGGLGGADVIDAVSEVVDERRLMDEDDERLESGR